MGYRRGGVPQGGGCPGPWGGVLIGVPQGGGTTGGGSGCREVVKFHLMASSLISEFEVKNVNNKSKKYLYNYYN